MSIILKNANVITMTDEKILQNTDILITGDKIKSINSTITDAEVINCSGKYIIPGLADMHVHINLASDEDMKLFVANGITCVRNMNGSKSVLKMKEKTANEREFVCPLIYTSTPILDGNPPVFPFNIVLETPEDAKTFIIKAKEDGYDFLKVYNNLKVSVYMEILKTARETGLDVIGHIPVAVGAEMAIEHGQYGFEHIKALKRDQLAPAAKAGIYFTPTLIVQKMIRMIKADEISEDMYNEDMMQYVSPDVIKRWRETVNFYKIHDFKLDRSFEEYVADAKVFLDFGGKLLAGTDTQNPFIIFGFSLHDELELFAQSGISCYEILKAATINGSESNHQEKQWGTIQSGKLANLVVLNSNPFENIRNTRDINAVILKGEYYNRKALDGFLTQVAKSYL